jgi:phosphatidylinositol alpha-mannosyltransferase
MTMPANRSTVPLALGPRAWARTRRALRQVDLVHVHEPFIPVVGWAALTLRDVPTVATFHADPPRWARAVYRGLGPAGERALREVVITATSAVSASGIPDSWGRPRIVPNAIDVHSYDIEIDRNPKRVAFLGRDDPRKGLSVLLNAWPSVRGRHPDAELEVLGADRQVRIPGVRFHGTADEADKRRVLASSQLFVAPNLGGESFGIVVAEGMAAGCAVIVSDIAAFRDVVGEAGVLVPPGDPGALSAWIVRLLEESGEARSLGDKARESIQRFDWANVLVDYREAYAAALS